MSEVNETAALKTQLDAVIEQMNALRLQLAESSGQQRDASAEENIVTNAEGDDTPPISTGGKSGAPTEDEPAATSVRPLGTDPLGECTDVSTSMLESLPHPVLRAPKLGRDRAAPPSSLARSTAQRVAQEYNTPNAPLLFLPESDAKSSYKNANVKGRRSTFVGTGIKVRQDCPREIGGCGGVGGVRGILLVSPLFVTSPATWYYTLETYYT